MKFKSKGINKKGVLGLDTVKAVMITFLILAVIGITLILTGVSLRTVADDVDVGSGYVNETTGFINSTGYTLAQASSGYRNFVQSITNIYNETDGKVILSGNYTLTGNVITNATTTTWSDTFIIYTWTYSEDTTDAIVGNVSDSMVDFFGNTTTIFAILIVVVIILSISIIIAAVSRFGTFKGM